MKIPVICSNVTSLPETIGDNKFTFDPNNIEEMAEKLYRILNDSEFIKENIINSEVQLKKLSWSNICSNFLDGYKQAIDNFKRRG
jgi:glycosyltransferase involved in cell wall biosynthesis